MAYVIDCSVVFLVVMLVIQWLVLAPVRNSFGISELWFHDSVNMQMYVFLTISLPVWFYFAFLDSYKFKGTIGKRLMKLNVYNKQNSTRISLHKSFIRTIFKLLPWEIAHIGVIFPEPLYFAQNPDIRMLSIAGLVLFTVYFISIYLDKNSQSLYDKLLDTKVVY